VARGDAPGATAGLRLAAGPRGGLGAWLVLGPFGQGPFGQGPFGQGPFGQGPLERPRAGDEEHLAPRLSPGGWKLVASADGPVDLAGALDPKGRDAYAYAGGVLHVEHGGRHTLLLGADDGVAVVVDGRRIFSRDEPRPQRDDDDLVALDLAPGDHTVVLALHQRKGPWAFRVRLLDAQLQPPKDAFWTLPGTTADDARALAGRMAAVTLDRGLVAEGYRPTLTVRFPEGAPRDVRLDVHARLLHAPRPDGETPSSKTADSLRTAPRVSPPTTPFFDVDAGEVGSDDRTTRELAIALPYLGGDEVDDDDWTLHVDVAGRGVEFPMRPRRVVREAVGHASRALAAHPDDSVEHLRDRLASFVAHGDSDLDAQQDDAHELDGLAALLEQGQDLWGARSGPMRRAYRSPVDGKLTEFALYVPPGLDRTKRYPLVVALHGMNGHPMEMLQWLFGHDDPARDGQWEDRHPRRELDRLDALVVAPDGRFNAMYRDVGEEDVMRAVDWVMDRYPIDEARVTITGPSMGGIGSAACALHHPDRFAAAEPLCGYHSYFVRGDIGSSRMHPWERFIAEERSNVEWAENGLHIPMFVVHGTKDLPEENSGVLIDRYIELGYAMKHEHPELGHNVWQTTYEDLKGARWLLWHKRDLHPRVVRFKTPRTRWADDAWVHVRELASSDAWGEVVARIDRDNSFHVSTHGVSDLTLDRDAERVNDAAPVSVSIDQSKLVFQAGEAVELHKEGSAWRAGPATHAGLAKRGTVTGPLRDVFFEPLLFVWGASDPAQARANEDAARGWARVRWGVHVDYPIMSDVEFLARGESLANDRALFLIGNAASNRLVRELEPSLPIVIEGDDVVVGGKHFAPKDAAPGHSQLGVAFVRPNPRRPERYIVVVEGVGPLGTWRSLSLPDMLPDWVVFDEDVGPARGGLLLGAGNVRAGGYFSNDWGL
jgi:predicted esterase